MTSHQETSHRQTVSFLQQRFTEAGIRPDTKRGQNFLVDLNLLEVLVREAEVGTDDVVLEVGTGTGALAAQLADRAAAVVTVEVDRQLYQLASEELSGRDNVVMLRQDVLRNKNTIHPAVIEAVGQQIEARQRAGYKLVANLPFQVATPVLSNLLAAPIVPRSMTVTIQKELADRITAKPGSKQYGALSVWVQSLCDTQIVRLLPPSVFWPRPKVSAAILRVLPRDEKRAQLTDWDAYHQFVRALFLHRRKFLRSALASAMKHQLSKPQVDEILASLGLAADRRAEQLDLATMRELYEAVRAKRCP
jgi:16S rRNA (adenine1518-N6/adenine1519-N6)-dimethyltransferase